MPAATTVKNPLEQLEPLQAMPGEAVARTESGKTFRFQTPQVSTPAPLQDRNKYEQSLFEQYGNPYPTADIINRKVDEDTQSNARTVFDHVFGGQFRYEDRQHMDKKAQDYYKNALLQYRKNSEKELLDEAARLADYHTKQMAAYDQTMKNMQTKSKEPTIADYKTFEEMVYNMTHTKDANGKTIEIPASDISMKVAKVIGEKLGILLEERKTPEKKGTGLRGFAWMGEPSAPAKTTLGVSKVESRNPGETPAQWRKRTGR